MRPSLIAVSERLISASAWLARSAAAVATCSASDACCVAGFVSARWISVRASRFSARARSIGVASAGSEASSCKACS